MTREDLIQGLNLDLANEYQAIITYITYAAVVSGLYRREMNSFFLSEVPDELRHAQFLANKIAAMGGQPTVETAPVPFTNDLKTMLENIYKAEKETVERYKERMRQAEEFGDFGLANDLQGFISDETGHMEEVQMLLKEFDR